VVAGSLKNTKTRDENGGIPPEVIPGTIVGNICSNIGLSGESCDGAKNKDDLCHMLGDVPVRFTMHWEYQ